MHLVSSVTVTQSAWSMIVNSVPVAVQLTTLPDTVQASLADVLNVKVDLVVIGHLNLKVMS